jgi:glycosyltransferase involved in cell wall biosynthesis
MYWAADKCGAVITTENSEDAQVLSSATSGRVRLMVAAGVDLHYFSPGSATESVRATRNALGLNGDRTALFVGRLIVHKGIGELIDAWRRVRANHRDAQLLIVGEPDHGNPCACDTADLKGEKRVELLGRRSDVRELIALSDIVVNPTYYREGLPRINMEALAMGKPIVTTQVPGCTETVEDGVNGLLVPARDAEALADAIDRLLSDPDLRRRMGQESRLKAQNFSIEHATFAVAALYDDLRPQRPTTESAIAHT